MDETKGHEIIRSDSRSEDEIKDCLDLFDVSSNNSNTIFMCDCLDLFDVRTNNSNAIFICMIDNLFYRLFPLN
jgi:hypothetical protein